MGIFNLPAENDIIAVKNLSRTERDELRDRINSADPAFIFTAARESRKPDVREIICPICGNGSGSDKTPVDCKFSGGRWLYNCFRDCGFRGDLIKIIGEQELLNPADFNDFCRILAIGANLIGDPIASTAPKKILPPPPQPAPPVDDSALLDLIRQDVRTAYTFQNLERLYVDDKRGLTDSTIQKFHVGFLKDWTHPKNRLEGIKTTPSRRLIVPTSEKHYNAVIPPDDRQRTDKKLWKMHAGKMDAELFNRSCLDNAQIETVFIVEGEFDAMSIDQAATFSDKKFSAVATLGVSNWRKTLIPHIENFRGKKNFIMFDGEDKSREAADKLCQEFLTRKIPATCVFLFDVLMKYLEDGEKLKFTFDAKIDCNDILRTDDGNFFLRSILEDIIKKFSPALDAAAFGFDETDFFYDIDGDPCTLDDENIQPVDTPAQIAPELQKQIDDWQEKNGKIPADTLADLISFAERFKTNAKFDADTAKNLNVQLWLGRFRYYNFFADITDNYFEQLRDAKRAAKKIIADYEKTCRDAQKVAEQTGTTPTLPDKPDDKFFALKRLKIEDIEADVNKFRTKAKKIHLETVTKIKEAEFKANEELRRKNHLENNLTLKNICEDCPADLLIPYGVEFGVDGKIIVTDENKPPKGSQQEHPKFVAAYNFIVPTATLLDKRDGTVQYEIAIRRKDGGWAKTVCSGRTLADSRAINVLGDCGAQIVDSKYLSKYFAMILSYNAQLGTATEIDCYRQPGWRDGKFILPAGDVDYVVKRDGIDYQAIFTPHGKKDIWLKKFDDVFCSGSDLFTVAVRQCVIGAAAAAPTLEILQLPMFILHVEGLFNSGKTPLCKFAQSAFANPAEGKGMRSWGATHKNQMSIAAGFNSLPLVFDEGESMDGKRAEFKQKELYDLAVGIIGQANLRNGNVRQTENFRTVILSTGEIGLLKDTDKGGAYKRVVQLKLSNPIFRNEQARQLHIFCQNHYGLFLTDWINYISDNRDELTATFDKLLDVFYSSPPQNLKHAPDDLEETHVRSVFACFNAAYHFRICLGLDKFFDFDAAITFAAELLNNFPTKAELDDTQRAINMLTSFVAEHRDRFIIFDRFGNVVSTSKNFNGVAGLIRADNIVAFYPNAFKNIVERELGLPDAQRLARNLLDKGYIDADQGHITKLIRFDTNRQRVYFFKPDVLIQSVDNNNASNDKFSFDKNIEDVAY